MILLENRTVLKVGNGSLPAIKQLQFSYKVSIKGSPKLVKGKNHPIKRFSLAGSSFPFAKFIDSEVECRRDICENKERVYDESG